MNLNLYIQNQQSRYKSLFNITWTKIIKHLPNKYNDLINNPDLSINLIITDDHEIKELNKQWRNKDKPTDVLSFPYEEVDEGVFGEIFISLNTATKQAKEKDHSLEDELEILFIHGSLHLFGYDHILDEDYLVMDKLEKKIAPIQ